MEELKVFIMINTLRTSMYNFVAMYQHVVTLTFTFIYTETTGRCFLETYWKFLKYVATHIVYDNNSIWRGFYTRQLNMNV